MTCKSDEQRKLAYYVHLTCTSFKKSHPDANGFDLNL